MNENQDEFIHHELLALATEHRVPESMARELIHLLSEYPSLRPRGRLRELVDDLNTIFETARKEGRVEDL